MLFDEVHERSLDNDVALALALDAASALRPDLRLVAMSATLDVERFQRLLGNAPTIVSEGRSFPLDVHYAGRDATARIEPQMASAIRSALAEHDGSLLAFLPGVAEIERTADALGELPRTVELHKLHGGIDPATQRRALARPPSGMRKVVLATSIAETSVTLEDVRIVVDSGLARRPRYDRGAGLTRLVTERASRASVTQRAGRAARQAPGVAIRLWEEAATASLPPHDPPEILEADLSSLLLTCLQWGEADPVRLPFLDAPPAAALDEARRRLSALVLSTPRGASPITDAPSLHSPSNPASHTCSSRPPPAALALPRPTSRCCSPSAASAATTPTSNSACAAGARTGRHARKRHAKWRGGCAATISLPGRGENLALALALAFPDRLSRRRDSSGESWQSVGGRGFRLDPASSLASSTWLAVGEVAGHASGARILSAAAIEEEAVLDLFGDRIETRHDGQFDPATRSVTPTRSRRLGAIRLASGPDPSPDQDAIQQALLGGIQEHGLGLLSWDTRTLALRNRTAFAHDIDPNIPALDDAALLQRADEWLVPLLAGKRRLDDIPPAALMSALEQLLGYNIVRQLNAIAPTEFESPAGSRHPIDYSATAGPTVEVRAQALFGLAVHPTIANGRVPLILAITSPAGRPIQTTRDLAGFWAGSWRDVVKDMRGRYPKHPWPDDPASAAATLRTKRAAQRS